MEKLGRIRPGTNIIIIFDMTITFLANSKDGIIMNQASKGNSKAKRLGIRKSKPSLKGFRFLENYISGNPTIRYYVVQICPKNEK